MPGMNSGLNANDPTVVAAFKSAVIHQGIIALLIFALLSLAWVSIREWTPAARAAAAQPDDQTPAGGEPDWRKLLRIGFGILWIFDGVLQAQPAMAVGLPSQVIQPTAASSPGWVQHLVNWAGTTWSYHPIQAGAAAVWIQVGIGIWLIAGSRGPLSRLAGLASAGWGLVVWVFGESFGGIFAPGLTWLFGAPGAAALYSVAGILIALPERSWRAASLRRLMLPAIGLFLIGMAILQAWPGRGFWQGASLGQPGTLAGMVQSMAGTSQPGSLSALVSGFGSLVRGHGFAVNLVAVIVLAGAGVAFLSGRPRLARPAAVVMVVFCLADWILIEDLGFFGGLGTDPNSMIPMALLIIAGYLALTRAPSPAAEPSPAPEAGPRASWRDRLSPAVLRRSAAAASARTMLSVGALGVIILGVVPMAQAQASPEASTILAQAIDGSTAPLNSPAPAFALTDQHGKPVSLASLRGKAVLLTFLDPVCVTDCPLEAQELKQAGVLLGAQSRQVALVAVNLNPAYNSLGYIQAFDRQERLTGVPGWLYLTGSPAQLRQVWRKYGIASQTLPAGSMLGHSDAAFVIDPAGRMREELDFDPGPGTAATQSSFAAELAGAARQALGVS